MKNKITPYFLVCFLLLITQYVFSQTFEIKDSIITGPYLEVTDSGFNVYTWGNRKGYMSKKTGPLYSGREPVQVEVLTIHRFDSDNKLIATETHAAKLDEFVLFGGSYYVCERTSDIVIPSETNAFASSADRDADKITDEFPASLGFIGKLAEEKSYYKYSFTGGGLLGGKKPYELVAKERFFDGRKWTTKNEYKNDVKDFEAGENEDWKWDFIVTDGNFHNKKNGASVMQYAKHVKKDKTKRFNYLYEIKLVGYDKEAKEVSVKDMDFKKPMFKALKGFIYNTNGEFAGFYVSFTEAYGLGYKKLNPEPNKKRAVFVMFDENAQYQSTNEIELPFEVGLLTVYKYGGIIKTENGHKLLLQYPAKKKEKRPSSIQIYDFANDKTEMGQKYEVSNLIKNYGDVKFSNTADLGVYQETAQLGNGDALLLGRTMRVTGTDTKVTTYPKIYYMRINAAGEIVRVGAISRGANANLSIEPTMEIENIDDNRSLISFKEKGIEKTYWLYNSSQDVMKEVKPKADLELIKVTKDKNNTIYFMGRSKTDKTKISIEKIDL